MLGSEIEILNNSSLKVLNAHIMHQDYVGFHPGERTLSMIWCQNSIVTHSSKILCSLGSETF